MNLPSIEDTDEENALKLSREQLLQLGRLFHFPTFRPKRIRTIIIIIITLRQCRI